MLYLRSLLAASRSCLVHWASHNFILQFPTYPRKSRGYVRSRLVRVLRIRNKLSEVLYTNMIVSVDNWLILNVGTTAPFLELWGAAQAEDADVDCVWNPPPELARWGQIRLNYIVTTLPTNQYVWTAATFTAEMAGSILRSCGKCSGFRYIPITWKAPRPANTLTTRRPSPH